MRKSLSRPLNATANARWLLKSVNALQNTLSHDYYSICDDTDKNVVNASIAMIRHLKNFIEMVQADYAAPEDIYALYVFYSEVGASTRAREAFLESLKADSFETKEEIIEDVKRYLEKGLF